MLKKYECELKELRQTLEAYKQVLFSTILFTLCNTSAADATGADSW